MWPVLFPKINLFHISLFICDFYLSVTPERATHPRFPLVCGQRCLIIGCLCSPCCRCAPGPPPRARAWFITWQAGLGVCVALSAVSGFGDSGEFGCESLSNEKYPLDWRRGRWNIVLVWYTPKLALNLEDGESGSRPADGGSSPLPSGVGATSVEPSGGFGGLLDEQSGTVSLGFHHSARVANSLTSVTRLELRIQAA